MMLLVSVEILVVILDWVIVEVLCILFSVFLVLLVVEFCLSWMVVR